MSIEPPFPAVSRPSNRMTSRCPVSDTQRAIALSSRASGFRSSSYSSSLSFVSPLMRDPFGRPTVARPKRESETLAATEVSIRP